MLPFLYPARTAARRTAAAVYAREILRTLHGSSSSSQRQQPRDEKEGWWDGDLSEDASEGVAREEKEGEKETENMSKSDNEIVGSRPGYTRHGRGPPGQRPGHTPGYTPGYTPERTPERRYDPIPFDLPPDMAADLEREQAAAANAADGGTITPLERRAFRRIFKEISSTRQKHENEAAGAGVEMPLLRARINSIVDEAADAVVRARGGRRAAAAAAEEAGGWAKEEGEEDEGEEGGEGEEEGEGEAEAAAAATTDRVRTSKDIIPLRRRQALLEQFPASLRAAAGAAMGIKAAERERRRSSTEGEEEADEEGGKRSVAGDAEGEGAETAGAAAEEDAPKRPSARQLRQEKMELQMLARKSDFALWDYMEERVFTLPAEFGLSRMSGPPPASASRALAAYAPLYPALLLHGVRLLDSRFGPGGSPLALAVLPRVKALGLASYVLGAGTALYNAELAIRWGRQGDWATALRLLGEMQRAGLSYDDGTLAVVRSMEWHLVGGVTGGAGPGSRPGPRLSGRPGAGPGLNLDGTSSFASIAARQLPETAGRLPDLLHYWRQQVERGISLGRR